MTRTDDTSQATAHSPEPWHSEPLQADNGGSIAICNRQQGILAVIPPLNEDEEPDEATAQREPCDEANARRICAAVNACKGLSTESLERGVVAELRHALATLLDAAGDLDAAIDGATDQFDDERPRLDAAIRSARAALDEGMEMDIHELLASRRQIALVWSVEDVQGLRPELTDGQAWEVLRQVERRHDAELGVTWLTLELTAEDEFGPAPETDAQEA